MLSFADTLAILPQQLVFGLTLGTAYGLIAIGYTMVYGVLFMINFAHGDVFMIGAYIGWALLGVLFASHVVPMNPFIVLPLLLVAAMVVTGAARPAARTSRLSPALPARRNAARSADQRGRRLDLPAERRHADRRCAREGLHDLRGLPAQPGASAWAASTSRCLSSSSPAIALVMMLGLNWLVQRTWLGRSIRAVAEDREMAAVMGIDVWRVVALTFCIGSALGGAAGVLVGFYYTQVDFYMGYSAGLKAFTAAVLGGIGNVRGAMLGGLILGVVESLAVTFINPAFKDAIAFVVLILVLMFRPGGLLGEALPDWKRV